MYFEIRSNKRIISFECVRGFIRMKQSVHSNEFPKPFEAHFQRLKHQFLIHLENRLLSNYFYIHGIKQ